MKLLTPVSRHIAEDNGAVQAMDSVPYGWLGPVGVGLPDLTQNVKPPRYVDPEDEIGIGRAPGMQWSSTEHPIYDNPEYLLDQPMQFPEGFSGEYNHISETADMVGIIADFDFYQNHLERNAPGPGLGWDTTVPNRVAIPNSQVSVLP